MSDWSVKLTCHKCKRVAPSAAVSWYERPGPIGKKETYWTCGCGKWTWYPQREGGKPKESKGKGKKGKDKKDKSKEPPAKTIPVPVDPKSYEQFRARVAQGDVVGPIDLEAGEDEEEDDDAEQASLQEQLVSVESQIGYLSKCPGDTVVTKQMREQLQVEVEGLRARIRSQWPEWKRRQRCQRQLVQAQRRLSLLVAKETELVEQLDKLTAEAQDVAAQRGEMQKTVHGITFEMTQQTAAESKRAEEADEDDMMDVEPG